LCMGCVYECMGWVMPVQGSGLDGDVVCVYHVHTS